jgi:predicted house-cleaning noncanonical NTP pyrophosphatase (MazG superfamily)
MLPEKKPKGSSPETIDLTHNQDQDLEKIRYYRGTWKNFFDYWNKRGVKADPYEGVELTHPVKKVQTKSTLPHQDFGTYNKADMNKLTESFEEFMNESNLSNIYDEVELILSKDEDFDRVKKLLRTDKQAKELNFTHWSMGMPLGSIRGRLVTMYFANDKKDVESFITRNSIKVANLSNFDL